MPPSFLVNQLLDLMARQRREVIPKCSTHQTQVTVTESNTNEFVKIVEQLAFGNHAIASSQSDLIN